MVCFIGFLHIQPPEIKMSLLKHFLEVMSSTIDNGIFGPNVVISGYYGDFFTILGRDRILSGQSFTCSCGICGKRQEFAPYWMVCLFIGFTRMGYSFGKQTELDCSVN